jgi:hypothetical protein
MSLLLNVPVACFEPKAVNSLEEQPHCVRVLAQVPASGYLKMVCQTGYIIIQLDNPETYRQWGVPAIDTLSPGHGVGFWS